MPVWRKQSPCSILVSNHECSSALTLSSCLDMILFEGLFLSLSNRDRDGSSIVKGKKCKSAVNSKAAGRRPRRHSVMHYFINFLPRLDWQDEMCIKPPRLDRRLAVAEKKSADCTRNPIQCAWRLYKLCKMCTSFAQVEQLVPQLCIGCVQLVPKLWGPRGHSSSCALTL